MRITRTTGFSLIEVVIAVGIFAVAVATILALLPSLTRQSSESADLLAAQQLPDAIRVELQRLATGNFDGLATTIPVMSAPLSNGLLLVAKRDGSRVQSLNYLPPPAAAQIPVDDQYFAVEVWRFNQAPLAYDVSTAVLPLFARVSGPYRVPGGSAPADLSTRTQVTFTLSLMR